MVYSTNRSKVVVPLLVLLFVALWLIVLCLTLCHFVLVFFSPFSIAITSLGEERELILVLFVRLFDLCLFGFVDFLFLFVYGKGCGFLLWHTLDFPLTLFLLLLEIGFGIQVIKRKVAKSISVELIPLISEHLFRILKSISNGILSSKIYDKIYDFGFHNTVSF